MTRDDWLAAWQVASTMFGWRRDEALVAVIDHAWRTDTWLRTAPSDLVDIALRQLEVRLSDGRRIVPADFTTSLRLEHRRRNPQDFRHRDAVGPITETERSAGRRGMALCRWVQAEQHEGRQPSGAEVAAKQFDPALVEQWGRRDDDPTNPASLIVGKDTP